MFEGFLRIVNGDEQVPETVVYDRIDKLDSWGCDRLVLFGHDAHRHRSFWDIYEHVDSETSVGEIVAFTEGRWMRRDDIRQAYDSDIEYIVPSDFANPFEDEMLAPQNYGQNAAGVLRSYPDASMWQTVTQGNSRQVQQFVEQYDWVGHVPPRREYGSIPEELDEWFEENEIPVYGASRWLFVHEDANHVAMGYPRRYIREIIERGGITAGTLYVDATGHLQTHSGFSLNRRYRLEMMDESDIREFAAEIETEWKGR